MNNNNSGRTSCHGVNKNESPLKRRTLVRMTRDKYFQMIAHNRICCDEVAPLKRPTFRAIGYGHVEDVCRVEDLYGFMQRYDPRVSKIHSDDFVVYLTYRGSCLRQGHFLSDYNINGDILCSNIIVSIHARVRGGASYSEMKVAEGYGKKVFLSTVDDLVRFMGTNDLRLASLDPMYHEIYISYNDQNLYPGHYLSEYIADDFVYCNELKISSRRRPVVCAEVPDFTFGQSYNVDIENYLINKEDCRFTEVMSVQAESGPWLDPLLSNYINQYVCGFLNDPKFAKDVVWVSSQLDNIFHIAYWFGKCENIDDYMKLLELAYKLIVGRPMMYDLICKVFDINPVIQGDCVDDFLAVLRQGLTGVQNVQNCEMSKKIVSMYSFLLVHGFMAKFGLEINDDEYTKLEQRALLANYSSKKEMWVCILDTTLFVCEKLNELRHTGDITVFMHNTSAYSAWLTEADRILGLAPFTSNLEAHGTTYFAFVSDLRDCIDKGLAYMKYTNSNDGADCALLKKKVYALQLLKNVDITRRAAQKERKAPYGILIYGSSSVAKSTFSKMCFYYYASLHNLPNDDHYRYVRSPMDEFWCNFDSSMWCIQLDDIALLLPSAAQGVDPTLRELINIINNVPYVPPQASLEDKGKTPVMSDLVITTSNSCDLNAYCYFHCPLAVQRRLPFVVDVRPKKEYEHENGIFIDPTKLQLTSDDYPDYWDIIVYRVDPLLEGGREYAKLNVDKEFSSVKEFLKYFGEATLRHRENQSRSQVCDETMKKVGVCPLCLYASKHCTCSVQAGERTYASYFYDTVNWFFQWIFFFQITASWFMWFNYQFARIKFIRRYIVGTIMTKYPEDFQIKLLGMLHTIQYACPTIRFVLKLIAGVSAVCAAFLILKRKNSKDETKTKVTVVKKKPTIVAPAPVEEGDEDIVVDDEGNTWRCIDENAETSDYKIENGKVYIAVDLETQGNSHGTVETQLETETSQNVWYNDAIQLSRFDLPISSQSLVNASDDQLRSMFERNCVYLHVIGFDGDTRRSTKIGGVFLKGHYCLTNNHAFKPGCTHYSVEIIQSSCNPGLTSNLKLTLKNEAIFRKMDRDVCVFEVLSVPPFKDIVKFWQGPKALERVELLVLQRLRTGFVEKRNVYNAQYIEQCRVETMDIVVPIYFGTASWQTQIGDCGAIAIAKTPRGCSIVGIHMLGNGTTCGYNAITSVDIEELISAVQQRYPRVEVQGGGEPDMTCNSRVHILGAPHHRSITRYLEKGTANVYGSFQGFRPRPRSHVCPTPLHEVFLEHYGVENNYGKPAMSGWRPWRLNVEQMVLPYVHYDKDRLTHCVQSFLKDILNDLPSGWEKELIFLSREASVNGLPGVKYIDRLNCGTSMGFPWCTTKKNFLSARPSERYPQGVTFDDEVWSKVDKIEAKYAEGMRAYPVFTGHLKDEATPLEKCKIQKTRVFTGAPVDWSLVVRSRLLSFIRLLQKNKFVFEAGPGTVCQSVEWGMIRQYLTVYGEDRMVAGDYGKFDKRMISDFILVAYQIIAEIHRIAGFSVEECREIMCIAEDTAFPVVNMNGDLIEFYGTNPSGHPLTVVINSLVNSLYMRYCYATLNPDKEAFSFKENVHLFTYGDDNIMGVSRKCNWFNHTAIQKTLTTIGVEYTMADKKAKSIPFIDIKDCSFLKRTWRYDEDVKAWLAPLEEASIIKSLTMWVPSGSVDKYAQMIDVMSAANSEYFFYGRDKFEKEHKFILEQLEKEPFKYYAMNGKFPSWDELVERFESTVDSIPALPEGLGRSQEVENGSQKSINSLNVSVEEVTESTSPVVENTISPSQSNENCLTSLQIQGDDTPSTNENVSFIETTTGEVELAEAANPTYANVDGTPDLNLGSFLARPTLINTRTWTQADSVGAGTSIKPWSLFLGNTAIKKKLDNFAFLRGKLHIKVVINATPFQYGCMRVAYTPLAGLLTNKISGTIEGQLIPQSQLPGFYIWPAQNAGGEMELPFLYHKNWLDITSATDVDAFGTLDYIVYALLRVAISGGGTSITIRTLAWMTDVELMGSTSKLALQGESDEYGTGAVSAPATAVANAASYLTKVPIIGPFARATQIGASAISRIATLFGYTNPPNISDVNAFYPMSAPQLATAEISVPYQKLSLDPKTELSIDPSPFAVNGEDQMSLAYIKDKESLFGRITWTLSNVSDDLLMTTRVTPDLKYFSTIQSVSPVTTVAYSANHTPLSYLCPMFENWRGSLIFRLKVVCTKYHKGRLKISYDPLNTISTTNAETNTVYTHILDLGETDEIQFEIPYHQALAWLSCGARADADNWSDAPNTVAPRAGLDNGSFTLRVFNVLEAPVSPSDVTILCYVKGGPDFEFANPTGSISSTTAPLPSFFAIQSEDCTYTVMGEKSQPHPERYGLNFGEAVLSLRKLLHRSVIVDTVPLPTGAVSSYNIYRKGYQRMPYTPGYITGVSIPTSANKIVASSGTSTFAFNTMHPIPWVTGMFVGYRGSVNYAVTVNSPKITPDDIRFLRSTDAGAVTATNRIIALQASVPGTDSLSRKVAKLDVINNIRNGLSGYAFTSASTNPTALFTFPDYNNYNFSFANPLNYLVGSSIDGTNEQGLLCSITSANATTTDEIGYTTIISSAGAGADFTCVYFLCCPTVNWTINDPTPVP